MATLRSFVLQAISVRAVALGGSLSENTLATGIGEDVQRIDDVKCLTHMWRVALGAGHGACLCVAIWIFSNGTSRSCFFKAEVGQGQPLILRTAGRPSTFYMGGPSKLFCRPF